MDKTRFQIAPEVLWRFQAERHPEEPPGITNSANDDLQQLLELRHWAAECRMEATDILEITAQLSECALGQFKQAAGATELSDWQSMVLHAFCFLMDAPEWFTEFQFDLRDPSEPRLCAGRNGTYALFNSMAERKCCDPAWAAQLLRGIEADMGDRWPKSLE